MHEEEGTMSKEDFKTYSDLFNAMVMTPYFPKPDVMIYLECNYDEVIDRIIERGREMEINTDPEYWKKLFKRYDDWINSFNACPVVRININEYDIHKDPDSLNPMIDKIARIIKNVSSNRYAINILRHSVCALIQCNFHRNHRLLYQFYRIH